MRSVPAIVDRALAGLSDDERSALERFGAASSVDERVVGTLVHAPRRLGQFVDFYVAVLEDGRAPRAAKELIERRAAELDAMEREGTLPADTSSLPLPEGLEPAEEVLVRFLDQYAGDWRAVPDDVYVQLREHYDNGQLVELFWFSAMVRSLARVRATLQIAELR